MGLPLLAALCLLAGAQAAPLNATLGAAASALPPAPLPPPPALPAVPSLPGVLDHGVLGAPVVTLPQVVPAQAVHVAPRPTPIDAVIPAVAVAGAGATLALFVPWRRLAWMAGRRFGPLAASLFSRIQGDAVLAHPTRSDIVARVAGRPGVTMMDLRAELGIAWGTLVHHVRLLETHGALVSVRQGPRRLLYAANTPEARARIDLALLRNATAQRIATLVQASPGIHQGALCLELEVAASAASKHLARFEAAGLVEVRRDGGRCHYGPTPRLGTALLLVGAEPVAPLEGAVERWTTHAGLPVAA
ncbi:MAG: winged helix-turn-helix transcriptional regulator [Thermoplasmatota archaeon]